MIILTVILYAFKCLVLPGMNINYKMFENEGLKERFGPKEGEFSGEFVILHNIQLTSCC